MFNFQRQLTNDEIRRVAPSVFAESASLNTSDKYMHVPSFKIMEGLIKADFVPVSAKQVGARNKTEHAKHMMHFVHRSMADKMTLGQEYAMLRYQNSHDGKSSYQLDSGMFRPICANGLVFPAIAFNSARIHHRKGLENDIIEASYRILNSFEIQTEQVKAMKSLVLSNDEQIILADSATRIVWDDETIAKNKTDRLCGTLLAARRNADQQNDLWTVFNRIQENAIKGGRRVYTASGTFQKMREVKSIDREKQINVELMTLAQKMAELKGLKIAA